MKIKLRKTVNLDTKAKKNGKQPLINKIIQILAVIGLVTLSACDSVESTNQAVLNPSKIAEPKESQKILNSVQLDLKSSTITKKEFLGLDNPEVKQAQPCPFLSDESALKIVKRSANIKRRETSNESCYWSKNLGFSIKLTIEPLTSAKPVKERAYNLDRPPVLKPQSGPGTNAVILYDTVWDKEQAYAISFEQDDKLVMIYVTGMATDAQRLTVAAREVAANLSTVAIINSQQDSAGEFNMCSIWNKSEIEAIIGTPISMEGTSDNCTWETGNDENLEQISIGIFYGKTYPWESVITDGATELSGIGERSVMIKQRPKRTTPGSALINTLYNERLVAVTISDTIDKHKAIALALSKNIDKRLN